jgi:Cu2+-exporting ATPase
MAAAATLAPSAEARSESICAHCGNTIDDASFRPYCCRGCGAVAALIAESHLERYYALRGDVGMPVPENHESRRDMKWLEEITARQKSQPGGCRVELDVQGLHCSACLWLIDELFARHDGALDISVNPTLGRASMVVEPGFDLPGFVQEIERFGYLFGPARKTPESRGNALVWRMGVCIVLAMNAMIFAISQYAGLSSGPTYDLFQKLNLGISCVSMAVGGTVFIKSAWLGLRRGVLHLDLPIALGVVLAFGGSLVSFFRGHGSGVYIDTLDVFIALMLVGRFLQERVLEKNRQALLDNDGVDGLLTRKVTRDGVITVPCTTIQDTDELSISSGDLLPVDSLLLAKDGASFSLDWINGESRARAFAFGDLVPAGAFLQSKAGVTVCAQQSFADSPLTDLLRTPRVRDMDAAMSAPWWGMVTKFYVAGVLLAAALGFIGWTVATGDASRAVEITTAVLVVTCPCAFGIATPIGYDLVQAGLRRAGLFVRSAGFLDRAARVKTVVFDKTGTLTNGALTVRDPKVLDSLSARDRDVLFTMVATSSHPKSAAVEHALRALGAKRITAVGNVAEEAACGLHVSFDGHDYRFGSPSWVSADSSTTCDVALAKDGKVLAEISTDEWLRPDARAEVAQLGKAGFDVWLLSGDAETRTREVAALSGIAADHARGDVSTDGKADFIKTHDHQDLLMIGDGINDSAAVATAFASGTPTVDRPFMAARSDFYFTTPGLRPVRLALVAARKLAAVRKRNLGLAITYNIIAVTLAYAGVMSPLLCAVFMPASSITTILATTYSLSKRSPLWRS